LPDGVAAGLQSDSKTPQQIRHHQKELGSGVVAAALASIDCCAYCSIKQLFSRIQSSEYTQV
jgi:hypothetical protein